MEKIEENCQNKENHFKVHLKNGKSMHLKCKNQAEKNSWVQSLSGLIEIWRDKKLLEFSDTRKYKDETDPRIVNIIMQELEGKNPKFAKMTIFFKVDL